MIQCQCKANLIWHEVFLSSWRWGYGHILSLRQYVTYCNLFSCSTVGLSPLRWATADLKRSQISDLLAIVKNKLHKRLAMCAGRRRTRLLIRCGVVAYHQ